MAEAAQARVQENISKMFEELDKSHLRKMQGDMYRCSARCTEQMELGMDQVQRCVEKCSKPITEAQQFIENELKNYQDRLHRCALQCQDNARDKVSPNTTEVEVAGLKKEVEACVVRCAEEHINLVPNLMKRIKETISQSQSGSKV